MMIFTWASGLFEHVDSLIGVLMFIGVLLALWWKGKWGESVGDLDRRYILRGECAAAVEGRVQRVTTLETQGKKIQEDLTKILVKIGKLETAVEGIRDDLHEDRAERNRADDDD